MHVLVPVYFRAPLGGLHSHVLAQARALVGAGHTVTCLLPPGPFADFLRSAGFGVLETSYANQQDSLATARAGGPYDLVHAHPFRARAVGLALARELGVPFALTFHGPYLDRIAEYGDDVDLLVTVSEAARDGVLASGAVEPARVVVVPNGVDTSLFHPRAGPRPPGPPCVAVVSRLDPDKQILLDAVKDAWDQLDRREAPEVRWVIAGDGASRLELETAARSLEDKAGRPLVTFLGWQDEHGLAEVYRTADVAVAPGRCALEALASGTPTIAIGSRGYGGPVDGAAALRCVHANFGGFAEGAGSPPALLFDVERILRDDAVRTRMAASGRALAEGFFSQSRIDRQIVSLTEMLRADEPRSAVAGRTWRPFEDGAPVVGDGMTSVADWRAFGDADKVELGVAEDALRLGCSMALGEKVYIGRTSLAAPLDSRDLRVAGGELVILKAALEHRSGSPTVSAWLVQLDDETERVAKTSLRLVPGDNELQMKVLPTARRLRLALRLAGEGEAEITSLRLERRSLRPPTAGEE